MSCNVRVELHGPVGRSKEEKERAFRALLRAFTKKVDEAGIKPQWKQKQVFESNSAKSRRKRRQAELERKKAKLREHFG